MRLAVEDGPDGQPPIESEIARRLHMDRKKLRKTTALLRSLGILSLLCGGKQGVAKRHVKGPNYPEARPEVGEVGDSGGCPPPHLPNFPRLPLRAHNNRPGVPVYEDELWWTDTATGQRRPWTFGMWAGDYKFWEHNGTRHYYFRESKGAWEMVLFKEPRKVHAFGKKARTADRLQVGTVVLYPKPVNVSGEMVKQKSELMYRASQELLNEIGANRRLHLHGLLIALTDPEFAFETVRIPDAPPGRTLITADGHVFVDHSKGPEELEVDDPEKVEEVQIGIEAIRQVPDIAPRLARIEERLEEVMALLRRTRPDSPRRMT